MTRRAGTCERALLVECALAFGEDRPGLRDLAAAADGCAFAALARACAASGLAAHALLASGVSALPDPAGLAILRDDAEATAAHNALLLREASALQHVLGAHAIPSLALKGTGLLAAHYPSLGARAMADVDLLVSRADLERAWRALEEAGCTPLVAEAPLHDGRPAATPDADPGCHVTPVRTPGGVTMELHWRAPAGATDVGGLFALSREVRWQDRTLRIPSPEDLAGVACAHVLAGHRQDPLFRIRLLADLAVLAAGGADLDAAQRRYGAVVAEGRRLLAEARAHPSRAVPFLAGSPLAPAWVRACGLAGALRRAGSAGSLARFFFPSRAFLVRRYGVPEDARWWPLLWLWRPIASALRVFAGS